MKTKQVRQALISLIDRLRTNETKGGYQDPYLPAVQVSLEAMDDFDDTAEMKLEDMLEVLLRDISDINDNL